MKTAVPVKITKYTYDVNSGKWDISKSTNSLGYTITFPGNEKVSSPKRVIALAEFTVPPDIRKIEGIYFTLVYSDDNKYGTTVNLGLSSSNIHVKDYTLLNGNLTPNGQWPIDDTCFDGIQIGFASIAEERHMKFKLDSIYAKNGLKPGATFYLIMFLPHWNQYDFTIGAPGDHFPFETYSEHLPGYIEIGYNAKQNSGLAYIDNGESIGTAYQSYIDDGSGFNAYTPYIDNGTTWDVYG